MDHNTYVIVPVYNEATVVRGVVDELMRSFSHVVCVDDGSADASSAVLSGSGAAIVRHPVNLGQGAALQTGLTWALRDPGVRYFATFDSDGQHRVEDLQAMVEVLETTGADVVFGTRFAGGGGGPTGLRRIMLRMATAYTNKTLGIDLTDTRNGLRAFNRRFAESLDMHCNDMVHASEIIEHAARGDFKVAESPTTVLYTEYSRSKGQSLFNGVNVLFDTLIGLLERGRK